MTRNGVWAKRRLFARGHSRIRIRVRRPTSRFNYQAVTALILHTAHSPFTLAVLNTTSSNLPLSFSASLLPSKPLLPLYRMSDHEINYHEIYARNLLSDNGFAPWLPRPVNIAEVGYVDRGRWMPLFDASKEPGDESNGRGVPNGYRPLDVGELDTAMESGGSAITNERGRSLEIGIKGSSAMCVVLVTVIAAYIFIREISAVTSAEGQYKFTSSKQEGAILVPGDVIDTADAVQRSRYIRYIQKNSASWLEFANERHDRDIRLIDLVLVTGWHKTASWACAAFSQCSREITLTFNVGVGTTQGGIWGKWSDTVSPGVRDHSGPVRAGLKDGQRSAPQSDKSPMDVDNLENIKLCISNFHWVLGYGYQMVMPGLRDLNRWRELFNIVLQMFKP